ncbi:Pyrogallol hydroxytransferase small subunit [subsurface metagenome]
MKAFIIDVSRCNGCYNCQIACKDEHVGNDWSPYAKPQPDTGQFWLKINELVRGTVPKVKVAYVPVLCMHCDDAPCIAACPIEGAIYKRDDGLVIIDSDKCTGCKNCVDSCPYGVIYFNEDLNIAQKCTGCAHLLDGGWKEPRCVDACPTEAIKFGEESELSHLISQAEVLNSEFGVKPRVYYLNLPKRFVAGTVYDPSQKEVVIGATCTLMDSDSRARFTATTDGFGDFWFEGLKVGTFSLKIAKNGKTKTIDLISTEKDVNLGDIPLA